MPRLLALGVGGTVQPWRSLGLSCSDATAHLADITLDCDGGDSSGLLWWSFSSDRDADLDIDGIPTRLRRSNSEANSEAQSSPIGPDGNWRAVALDHVVVNTHDGERTSRAIEEALGLELRRIRDLPRGMQQRFHRADNTIIEVVSGPQVATEHAMLWGMVASVDDLVSLSAAWGDEVISPPKDATQAGRLISTVRRGHDGGVPFALMTPHVSSSTEQ